MTQSREQEINGEEKEIERSQWEFFQDCKSEKGSGREGGNRREKRPKRDQGEEKMMKQLERTR